MAPAADGLSRTQITDHVLAAGEVVTLRSSRARAPGRHERRAEDPRPSPRSRRDCVRLPRGAPRGRARAPRARRPRVGGEHVWIDGGHRMHFARVRDGGVSAATRSSIRGRARGRRRLRLRRRALGASFTSSGGCRPTTATATARLRDLPASARARRRRPSPTASGQPPTSPSWRTPALETALGSADTLCMKAVAAVRVSPARSVALHRLEQADEAFLDELAVVGVLEPHVRERPRRGTPPRAPVSPSCEQVISGSCRRAGRSVDSLGALELAATYSASAGLVLAESRASPTELEADYAIRARVARARRAVLLVDA